MATHLGLGPVFTYEWLTNSRRRQVYAGRSLFVAALLAALAVAWTAENQKRTIASVGSLATLGQSFFFAITGTQLALVLLAAPAATAGAICQDKARGILTHLLVTDLSDVEIVLGKLAARLIPVAGLVLCALPVMALGMLLGGIDPTALVRASLVTIGVAILGASLALALSVWASRAYEVLLAIYFLWVVWLLAESACDWAMFAMGWTTSLGLGVIDPFSLAFLSYIRPGVTGVGDCAVFLAVCIGISAAVTVVAVYRVRAVSARQSGRVRSPCERKRSAGWIWREVRWWSGPSLDQNPVLWREWHRNRPSRWGRALGIAFGLIAAAFTALAILDVLQGSRSELSVMVNGFQASIGLLMAAVVAATSLSEERTRGSLDVVLATPMRTSAIVLGKWWGAFRVVPSLTILPTLLAAVMACTKPVHWIVVPLIAGLILSYGAALAGLGLALATWIPRVGRVVALTVVIHVLINAGGFFLCVALMNRQEDFKYAMANPFFGVALLTISIEESSVSIAKDCVNWAFIWIVFYAHIAVILFLATLATFDRCLGRMSERPWRSRTWILPGRIAVPYSDPRS